MNKKIFLVPILSLLLLTGCKETPTIQYRFNVNCTNCSVNFEDSISINVNANELVRFSLTAKEGYLLPTEVVITAGNQILIRNIDYAYLLSEDRLTGEITIKANKATEITIDADEQGYLYIGNNKISKSGDYSKFDSLIHGDNEDKKILYDYKTNTLTLTNTILVAEEIGLKEYSFPFESEEEETFFSLISWTGGGTLNIKVNGLNYFTGGEDNDDDCAIVCPFDEGKINIVGPGSMSFYKFDAGVVMNSRGRTSIKDVYCDSFDLGEFAISSRELDITNSDLQFASGSEIFQSVGIYANDCVMLNSYVLSNNFYLGTKIAIFTLIDSFIEANALNTGIYAQWLRTYGHVEDGKYSTKVYAKGISFGVSTVDAMDLSNTEIVAVSTSDMTGHALLTVDSEIIAINCDIYAHSNCGQAIHGHYVEFINSNIEAICDDGIGILTSIRGAQPLSREYEPVLNIINSNVHAQGSDVAIYGFGHLEYTSCGNFPKYLEEMLSEELQLWIWALVDDSVDKLEYEGHFDPESGAPWFVPTNALTEVEIKAAN